MCANSKNDVVETFLRWNDAGIDVAKQVGVPVLLSEYNSVACGGDPNVSPTVRKIRYFFFNKIFMLLF